MSLLNPAQGPVFNVDSDQIYTGASLNYIYTPPAGERILVSDIVVSAEDALTALILVGPSGAGAANTVKTKRRVFLAANGGWVENRVLPIEGDTDESLFFQIVTATANATISVAGEHLKR